MMNVCRICLSTNIYRDVFELENEIKDGKSSSDIMLYCLDLKVTQESPVSTRLCSQCFATVIAFYKFKVSALKNDEYFRNWHINISIDTNIQVKIEAVENPEAENEYCNVTEDKCVDYGPLKVEGSSDIDGPEQIFIKQEPNTEIPIEVSKEDVFQHPPPIKKKREIPKTSSTVKSENSKTQSKDESCSNVTELQQHSSPTENGGQRKTYPCQACDKVYFTSFACKKHYRVRHLNIKDKCSICDKEVIGLANHMILAHDPSKLTFRCDQCPRAFYSKSNLKWHARLHANERPFSCHLCDAKFATAFTLKNHVSCVHEKQRPFMCDICSRYFTTKGHLTGHIRSHEGLKPFKCEECGKCVTTARSLRKHRMVHTGEKPYACTLCEKRLANSNSLRRHMIWHTNERNFPCSYCDMRFTRADHRNTHQRTVHGQSIEVPGPVLLEVPVTTDQAWCQDQKGDEQESNA